MSKNYLVEIGVEELPARYINNALEQFKDNIMKLFQEERINFEEVKAYATPRRLALIIYGIDEKQADINEKIKGPTARIAFDENFEPTKALLGFMKGQGIDLPSVYVEEFKGEDYIFADILKKGKSLEEVISKNMANMIKAINFPKSMKWGGKNIKFSRPIRWIVSLLDRKIIDFKLEGIPVSNVTRGHRFLGSSNIEIPSVDKYVELLRENYVIVDQEERLEIIKYGSERLVKEKGGNLQKDEELLEEVTNIVEYPTPLIGRINKEYLELPRDVVITPMKEHLRYFPVLDDKGRLLPYFVTVRNGNDEYIDIVTKGNEKVLGARLEDAKFFYMEDTKKSLEEYVEELKSIVFQEKLGTIYDKTKRVEKLVVKIGEYLEVGEETKKNVQRAAFLGKADLVTKLVGEFTELQGTMGMEYARVSGENEIVSLAILEQYLPKHSGDELPTTTAGSILSIADKLDTIVGMFAINIHPTGSQDPFGLRRKSLGIINIILEKKLNLSLDELLETALYLYVDVSGIAFDYNKVKEEIKDFFKGRIRNMFIDMGIRYDVVDSVINSKEDDIYDMKIKADKLSKWLEEDGISDILNSFKRVSNLARKAESADVSQELLTDDEVILYNKYKNIEEDINVAMNKKEYGKALDLLSTLKDPIDNYFEKVMVMVEDEQLKNNRLALLRRIYDTMTDISDLSKIVS